MAESPLPSKKDVTLALLERTNIRVFLDPRREGVVLPQRLCNQPEVALDIGLNMPMPIRDLDVTDDGITCTLSFNRTPFWCAMPWSSIFAIQGDDFRQMVWPDDIPRELRIAAVQKQAEMLTAVPKITPNSKDGPDSKPPSKKPKKRTAKEAKLQAQLQAEEDVPVLPEIPPPPMVAGAESTPHARPHSPSVGAKKTKRELPPYLRVIK